MLGFDCALYFRLLLCRTFGDRCLPPLKRLLNSEAASGNEDPQEALVDEL